MDEIKDDEIKDLVSGLRDFRARTQIIHRLCTIGEPCVPALIAALDNPNEGISYGAVRALGELRAAEACPALVKALDQAALRTVAAHALHQITGLDHGVDAAAWSRAISSGPAAAREELDLDAIVQHAMAGTSCEVSATRSGWLVTVPLKGGRTQRVNLLTTSADSEDDEMIVIYTECGPADAGKYDWALKQNLRMAYGAIGVREIAGKPMFVMVNTQLARTAQPDEIRKSVLGLAKRADSLEKVLTGKDEH